MVTKASLVRLEARPGKGYAVEDLLMSAQLLVEKEPGTKPRNQQRVNTSVRLTTSAGNAGQERALKYLAIVMQMSWQSAPYRRI